MKRKLTIIILPIVLSALLLYLGYRVGYQSGYKIGAFRGIAVSLDTVKSIMEKQFQKRDSCVTKVIFINPDTDVYYLSPKRLMPKE